MSPSDLLLIEFELCAGCAIMGLVGFAVIHELQRIAAALEKIAPSFDLPGDEEDR